MIRMKWDLLLFLLLGIACNQKTKKAGDKEYMDWGSAKINGAIPMISNVKQVEDKLGKPDSLIKAGANVDKSEYYFIKGLRFEKHNDTLVFSRIDFRNDTTDYLVCGNVKFDHLATLNYFGRFFPKSFNNELSGTDMDKYIVVGLDDLEHSRGSGWMFYFNEDRSKLLWIDHYVADRTE